MSSVKGRLPGNKRCTFVSRVTWDAFGNAYVRVDSPEAPEFWVEVFVAKPKEKEEK